MRKKILISIIFLMTPIIVLAFPKGDVDGSGKVDNLDYALVRNHISKSILLTGERLKRADIDGKNGVDMLDYVTIRNIIIASRNITPTPSSKNRCCCVTKDLKYCGWRNVTKCPNEQQYEDTSTKKCGNTPTSIPTPTPTPTATPKPTPTPIPTPTPTPSVIAVQSVSINKTSTTLEKGETDTVAVQVNPTNATNKTVTWTSNNNNVATVSNGIITAVSKGTAIITASSGGKSASITVTVNNPINRIHFIKQPSQKENDDKLSAGDAILIESNGHYGMVDTGLNNKTDNNFIINYLQSVGVTKLDFIIITHMHRDHTGGIVSLVKKFPVTKIYMKKEAVAGHESSKNDLRTVKALASKKGFKFSYPTKDGSSFTFGQMKIAFYNVPKSTAGGANGDSLLQYITVNNYKILLTGDLYNDKASTSYFSKISLKSKFQNLDLLKMPHHGYSANAFAGTKSGTYNATTYKNFNPKVLVVTRGACTGCQQIGAINNVVYVKPHNAVIFGFGKTMTTEYK